MSLGVVCFRVNPVNAGLDEETLEKINRTVLAHVFWDDPAFVSSTLLRKKFSLRMCILNHNTTWNDVRENHVLTFKLLIGAPIRRRSAL